MISKMRRGWIPLNTVSLGQKFDLDYVHELIAEGQYAWVQTTFLQNALECTVAFVKWCTLAATASFLICDNAHNKISITVTSCPLDCSVHNRVTIKHSHQCCEQQLSYHY